ncbi:GNAT family N-acetyltransferase [Candidatus Persebacteraceae bacterium Df01]|jgi:hypothetical protein|uniref:GNAT family N-acetyltransferase n=1 Tax=Candidatus Doriopsillibacter californiensis TaxID=2970740 RepID=A0ABT7QM62_9GAMM|nr:GNAT family N-acetyltransferase [Candidatus Persebacteraceae bacterium Df01]
MRIAQYSRADAQIWDDFINHCPMATFLHSRRFLSYHKNRFNDCSLLIFNNEKLCGVLPAAAEKRIVASHPGATYGGIVHNGRLSGKQMLAALSAVIAHYKDQKFQTLLYKAVPTYYHQRPYADDIYALHQKGARLLRCNLSSVIDLTDRGVVSTRRQRGKKKAIRANIRVDYGKSYAPAIWQLIEDNLLAQHNTVPAHTQTEILHLANLFSDNIIFYAGILKDSIVCGVVLFLSATVWHAQYIASNDEGRKIGALDFLFESLILQAQEKKIRYFSFGTSNIPSNGELNDGLHQFKQEFGAGSCAHLSHEISL